MFPCLRRVRVLSQILVLFLPHFKIREDIRPKKMKVEYKSNSILACVMSQVMSEVMNPGVWNNKTIVLQRSSACHTKCLDWLITFMTWLPVCRQDSLHSTCWWCLESYYTWSPLTKKFRNLEHNNFVFVYPNTWIHVLANAYPWLTLSHVPFLKGSENKNM